MEKKQKIKNTVAYYWEYYKVPMIGVVILVVLLFLLDIPSLLNKPETKWNGYFIKSGMQQAQADQWMDDFQKNFMQDLDEKHEYRLDTSLTFAVEEDSIQGFDQMSKFTALIAGHEIDFVVAEEDTIRHYAELGGFVDLEELLPEDQKEYWQSAFKEYVSETGGLGAYAVDLADTFLTVNQAEDEKRYVGAIPLNSERKEMTIQFLQYLEEEQRGRKGED